MTKYWLKVREQILDLALSNKVVAKGFAIFLHPPYIPENLINIHHMSILLTNIHWINAGCNIVIYILKTSVRWNNNSIIHLATSRPILATENQWVSCNKSNQSDFMQDWRPNSQISHASSSQTEKETVVEQKKSNHFWYTNDL